MNAQVSSRVRAGRGERGSQLVEMAIVTMLLLLLLAGVFDIGRLFHSYIVITNAAREGARYGIRLPCYPGNATQLNALKTAIVGATTQEAANSGVDLDAGNVTIVPDPVNTGCAPAGGNLAVGVSMDFEPLFGGLLGSATITLRTSQTMVRFGNDTE